MSAPLFNEQEDALRAWYLRDDVDLMANSSLDALRAVVTELLAAAWDDGFKQGGPMHDEYYGDPDAHRRNPYREGRA